MSRGRWLATAATLLAGSLASVAFPAEWETGAGVSVGSYYTDNICLSPHDEQGKWVGTVRPDVSLRGSGARANVSLQGGVAYNTLGNSGLECSGDQANTRTSRESFIPNLRFASDVEVVRDWLVLDANADARRTSINPFVAGADDPLSGRDNNNIVYSYGAGATLQRPIAQYAGLRMRYQYDEQFNEASIFGDSVRNRATIDLDTLPDAGRLRLGVGGEYSKVTYDDNAQVQAFDNELSSAEFRAALKVTSSWEINGKVGEEWNEFVSARDDIEGSFWDVGLRWTPNPRIEAEVGIGERFFGDTARANIAYRHKRSQLQASYQKSLNLPRNLRVRDAGFTDPDDPFDPDFGGIPGDSLGQDGVPTLIGEAPILNELFQLRYMFNARRTTIGVTGSESRQTQYGRLEQAEATFRNASVRITRSLNTILDANLLLSWRENVRENDVPAGGFFSGDSETWRMSLGLTRQLGQRTRLSVTYAYTTQSSRDPFNEYDENRLKLSVRHSW
ncbi:TIGR03016 family PEP-CTERM system-associated outer membrane protein [Haliea sp. E1-2-M8]|uniref:TIGR03016 family PEP-CTERM system-associated outer membrane protein n=1 Tax=Haliea sp. E1-2-M8 TaxID=3064706 RepID=UPI002718FE8C|nr:TIGR03016 family PEP-CTERM system-associated outer membrane protein [Haliea sp. E1-2-M8]MDO8860431.1 TIGR03016 family PEP-CTERM system-associated outer membrane protein [Haliea sp. E1-2-M8]